MLQLGDLRHLSMGLCGIGYNYLCSFIAFGFFVLGFIASNSLMNLGFFRACKVQEAKSGEEAFRVANKWMALGRNFGGLKVDAVKLIWLYEYGLNIITALYSRRAPKVMK